MEKLEQRMTAMEARIMELGRTVESNFPTKVEVNTVYATKAELNTQTTVVTQLVERMGAIMAQALAQATAAGSHTDEHDLGGGRLRKKEASNFAPDPWSGGKSAIPFREFDYSLKVWMMALHEDGVEMLERAVSTVGDINNETNHSQWNEINRYLYQQLVKSTTEEAWTYVQNVEAPNGFRAWRELARWYDPRGGEDEPAAMERVVRPRIKRATTSDEGSRALQEFETTVKHYESRFGLMAESSKIVGLKQIIPVKLLDRIRGERYGTYRDLRQVIVNYLNDRASEHVQDPKKQQQGPTPMDIGYAGGCAGSRFSGEDGGEARGERPVTWDGIWAVVNGKGKGKKGESMKDQTKGQSKGKGVKGERAKGKGKGGKGKMQCWNCAGYGHAARDCPSERLPGAFELAEEMHEGDEDPGEDKEFDDAQDLTVAAVEVVKERDDWKVVGPRKKKRVFKGPEYNGGGPALGQPPGLNHLVNDSDVELFTLGHGGDGWIKVEAAVDSGAMDSVLPTSMFPKIPLQESEGSRKGGGFKVANGGRIPNRGQKVVKFKTGAGQSRKVLFQVSDVTRPLISVSKIKRAGNDVHLDSNPRIVHKGSGEITPLIEKDGLHVLEMWVNIRSGPVFAWQGQQ